MGNDEPELIAHILDGSTEDFRTLVDRYKTTVYRHCFYIMHDEDLAEDMAQESFIRAYAKLRTFNARKGSFKAWLLTIATRECLSKLRGRQTLPLIDEDIVESTQPGPARKAEHAELRDAVRALDTRYRTVISLHYWQGQSYEEIATYMDVPIGSVRGWLHRAKQQLKEALS